MRKKYISIIIIIIIFILQLLIGYHLLNKNNRKTDYQIKDITSYQGVELGNIEIIIESESVNLPAKSPLSDYNHEDVYTSMDSYTFEKDTWITSLSSNILGAPTDILHHAVMFFSDKLSANCNNQQKIFYATTKESPKLVFKNGYGQFIPKGTTVRTSEGLVHFRNDTSQEYNNVKVVFKIEGTTDPSQHINPLDTFWLTIECATVNNLIFPVLPGKNIQISLDKPYIAPKDFKIHILASHIHDYGEKIEFTVNDQLIHTFNPISKENKIIKMPVYFPNDPIIINKGDKIDFTTFYNNPTDKITEGMGVITAFIEQ